jgi:hypothetical protein
MGIRGAGRRLASGGRSRYRSLGGCRRKVVAVVVIVKVLLLVSAPARPRGNLQSKASKSVSSCGTSWTERSHASGIILIKLY